jgi:hypothetical protein
MRHFAVFVGCLCVAGAGTKVAEAEADRVGYGEKISRKIVKHIRGTHLCQRKMDRPRTKVRLLFTKQSVQRRRYVLRVWIDRHDDFCDALRRWRRNGLGRPPHYQQWLCIHSHEGSWTDPGAPYYGGLQFGYKEWQRFGKPYTGVETANLASPIQQMWAAERYWRLSGFYPWPNTARMCGLL